LNQTGIEAFEGVAPAVAWSADGRSLFVSVRERTQSRLLELENPTLRIRSEIHAEPMEGAWNVERFNPSVSIVGATHLLPSPDGKLLVTYGRHSSTTRPYQIRIWRKSNDKWPQESAEVVDSKQPMLETEMTGTPMAFVNQQSSFLAVVGKTGIAVIDTRSGSVKESQELPDVDGRRPVALLSADGRWAMAGDREGNVWVWELRNLERRPRQFAAQAGPIMGLAMSQNGQFLATAGEENRIRVWDVSKYLSGSVKSTKK
jgi:WD40 repeat protein